MGKRIHHMGLTITKEEDQEWYRTHLTPAEQKAEAMGALEAVGPHSIGGRFVAWCVKEGWLVRQDQQCFATKEDIRALRERFAVAVGDRR